MYLECSSAGRRKSQVTTGAMGELGQSAFKEAVGGAGLQLLTNRQQHQLEPKYKKLVEKATKSLVDFLLKLAQEEGNERGFEVILFMWNCIVHIIFRYSIL